MKCLFLLFITVTLALSSCGGKSAKETVPETPPGSWPPTIGTYIPGPSTTGPRPNAVLKRWDGDYYITEAEQIVENLDIYGRVVVKSGGTKAVIRNCIIRGPGPLSAWKSTAACITSSSNSLLGLTVEDCRIDCRGRENPWVDGIRSGDVTVRRTEIIGTCDGFSLVSTAGNVTVEGCWIHNGYYTEWANVSNVSDYPPNSDKRVHGDCVQFHRGKNYIFRGNLLGGTRVPGAINTGDSAIIAAKDSGDDYENACFMIKQEVDSSSSNRLDNVLIENNWLAGGAASINLVSNYNNNLDGFVIRNNRFIRSTWGKQIYIIRDSTVNATLSGNVFDDNNEPVSISKGNQ